MLSPLKCSKILYTNTITIHPKPTLPSITIAGLKITRTHACRKKRALGQGNTHAFKDVKENAEATQGPITLRQTQQTETHANTFARVKLTRR